jgi:hypothetical protein
MKKFEGKPMNKTQNNFMDDGEILEEEDNLNVHMPKSLETCKNTRKNIHLPINIFNRKGSGYSPRLNTQPLKALTKFHKGNHLSPPSRAPNNKDKFDQDIGKLNLSPKQTAPKSPRENMHKFVLATKEFKEKPYIPKKPGEARSQSPKPKRQNPKLNEELWEASSKGDLIKITHLLDPYFLTSK